MSKSSQLFQRPEAEAEGACETENTFSGRIRGRGRGRERDRNRGEHRK